MSDDTLVSRAKVGDPEAWRALHRAHAGRLVAWLRTRPSGDASVSCDDIASEAWLVAAAKIADFEGDTSDFAGWLFAIARNINSTTRRRSHRRRTDPDELRDHVVTVPDPTMLVDHQDWVRAAISSLPPRERDVVGLIDGLGYDTTATAAALGISNVAVRTARHRGLRRLRRTMVAATPSDKAATVTAP
jgi:RNA polymerase sigma-70 factor (ECF subfamily)